MARFHAVLAIIGVMVFTGAVLAFMVVDMLEPEGGEFRAESKEGQARVVHEGSGMYRIQDVHVVVQQGGQYQRISQAQMTEQLGHTWDPGESLCVAGQGCLHDWADDLHIEVSIGLSEPERMAVARHVIDAVT